MDWRPAHSFRSSSSSPSSWLCSIMALIVDSASGGGRRRRRMVRAKPGSVRRRTEKALPATDGSRWPVSTGTGLLLTVALLVSSFLLRPIEGSNVAASSEVRVQDYTILASSSSTGSDGGWESVCGEPVRASRTEEDTLNLSELVTQSDVIFKAFAGHGNDLRDAALVDRGSASTTSNHRQQQQQQHHQPRWKANEDFVVRLEPGTVYKGNELFQQLQLNSWRHYFILWSNGSVEYSHLRGVPAQGRPADLGSHTPPPPPVDGAASLDASRAHSSASGPSGPSRSKTERSHAFEKVDLSAAAGRRTLNCSAWRERQRMATESTRPLITTHDLDNGGGGSSSDQPQPNANRVRKASPRAAGAASSEDSSISGETDGNRPFERDAERYDNSGEEARSPIDHGTGKLMQKPPAKEKERVNLPDGRDGQTSEGSGEAGLPSPSMEKDSKAGEGQISHKLNEILPVTLIVFGRLVRRGPAGGGGGDDNLLRVDPHLGLLRWDERLEDALWQALGWSKWSDYTGCSVPCGNGVQQRFRHCLQSSGGSSNEQREGNPSPPSSAERTVPTRRQGSLNGAAENLRRVRTQPVTVYAPPGASISTASMEDDGARTKGKTKPTKRASMDEKKKKTLALRRKLAEAGKGAIKRAPTGAESISSEVFEPRDTTFTPPRPSEARRGLKGTPRESGDDGTWPSCEGHNIEQRSCNMFECTGTIDLLTTAQTPDSHWRNWNEGIDDRINYEINQLEQNFTLMISLRVRRHPELTRADGGPQSVSPEPATGQGPARAASGLGAGGSILSVRSKLTTGPSLSINFVTDGHGGLRVIQEKYGLSEMLPVREPALLDGDWHSLALSGRNGGGFVTVYGDCRWINSFVLTKGSIELPQYPTVELGRDVEVRQLTVVPGEKSARLQCHSPPVPIRDVENRQVTNYFEHLN